MASYRSLMPCILLAAAVAWRPAPTRPVAVIRRSRVSIRAQQGEEQLASLEAALEGLKADGYAPEALAPLEAQIDELKQLAAGERAGTTVEAEGDVATGPRLPPEATQAIPDAGQARLPLSPDKPDPRAKIPGARELPPCTVVVAGANGRVGSKVVTELLRKHSNVRVRALVRSASRIEGYERLSYETGAEDGRMSIRPAWELGDSGDGYGDSGFARSQQAEYDSDVQASYGLDRLEVFECEVRHASDVARALTGADAVVFCASTFGEGRTRPPERLDNFNRGSAALGADLFELRVSTPAFRPASSCVGELLRWRLTLPVRWWQLPGFGRRQSAEEGDEAAARRRSATGKTADEDGVKIMAEELLRERTRRARLQTLTGGRADAGAPFAWPVPTPFVLISACAALGYEDTSFMLGGSTDLQENEYGYRKRMGEAALRASGVESVILRPAVLDQLRIEEGLAIESAPGVVAEALAGQAEGGGDPAGVKQDELRNNRIHTRDVARAAVASLFGVEGGRESSYTFELWTESFGKANPSTTLGAFFTTEEEKVRQKWRDEGRKVGNDDRSTGSANG